MEMEAPFDGLLVDGDGNRNESVEQDERPSTGPKYVFSVGDETQQSNAEVSICRMS